MLTDHELMAETKGPPAKRQRGDSPLETPNADPAGKCKPKTAYILFFSFRCCSESSTNNFRHA